MTDTAYRQLNRYANSDLSELLNLSMGRPARTISEVAAQFGTTFHQMILEPDKPVVWSAHHVKEHHQLNQMADSLRKFVGTWMKMDPLPWPQTEVVMEWNCSTTGLPLKAKLDAILTEGITGPIIDLKTTSCRTSVEFFDSIAKYGYDRQAAFYLDALGMKYDLRFIAIQKCKPYDVFYIDMGISHDRKAMIDAGRKKNARLLRLAHEESLKPVGWRPSSWALNPMSVQLS